VPNGTGNLREAQEEDYITAEEAKELFHLEQLHYDTVFGIIPHQIVPEDVGFLISRVIYTYIRLHPEVSYTPDFHHLVAPIVYVCKSDPELGARDDMYNRL
jgi:hypothetical protein